MKTFSAKYVSIFRLWNLTECDMWIHNDGLSTLLWAPHNIKQYKSHWRRNHLFLISRKKPSHPRVSIQWNKRTFTLGRPLLTGVWKRLMTRIYTLTTSGSELNQIPGPVGPDPFLCRNDPPKWSNWLINWVETPLSTCLTHKCPPEPGSILTR